MQLRHFGSIEELMAVIRPEVPGEEFFPDSSGINYMWVADGDVGRLAPAPASGLMWPYVFRGQTSRHSPSVPGVFRGLAFVDHPQKLSRLERARCLLARIRLEEFLAALAAHPAIEYSRRIGLAVCSEAIAQHYEMLTGRLDFSQDPNVAAFFATHSRTADDSWLPIGSGKGVIYQLTIPQLFSNPKTMRRYFEMVGKQVLPRPGEQRACTLLLPLGRDLEQLPGDLYTFDHDEAASRRIGELFDGGRTLFPPDVLAKVAQAIRTSKSIPLSVVGRVLQTYGHSHDVYQRELDASHTFFDREFGVSVVDRALITYSPAQLEIAAAYTRHLEETFLDDVERTQCTRLTLQIFPWPPTSQTSLANGSAAAGAVRHRVKGATTPGDIHAHCGYDSLRQTYSNGPCEIARSHSRENHH